MARRTTEPAVTTLFLVRHAAHDLVGKALCGRMPGVKLGGEGRAQAERLATRLSRETVAAVQASPLERARETAEPIARHFGLGVEVADAVNEIDVGAWTGTPFGELRDDPRWRLWNSARSVTRAPGGETMLEVQARTVAHMEALRARFADQAVVIVSHADVIKAALAYCLGLSLDGLQRFDIAPASLSTVVIGDWGAKVLSVNEVAAS
jgi:probable phosphomutase (TIGR03848 family)